MRNTYVVTDYGVKANEPALQTRGIQAVLDLCKDGGGTVIIPEGTYRIAALRMWSDTTLYLQSGATLLGSGECDDYDVFPIPAGVDLHTDMEYFRDTHSGNPVTYYRAMISAYGEKNISIIGEENTMIDGADCFDPDGEENYRGPHGIFVTNCDNVLFRGYTIGHSGNFMHQADNCRGITMQNVTCLGGSDGIHLHKCVDTLIENCVMQTGDDCVAGCNVRNLTVRSCELNTSCNFFRLGGVHILIQNCHMYGPGVYPHRMTIVKGKNDYLPREAGRHNAIGLMHYFGSHLYPDTEPSRDIVFRDCLVEDLDRLLIWQAGDVCQAGAFAECVFENVRFRNVRQRARVRADAGVTLRVYLKSVELEGGAPTDLVDTESFHTEFIFE